MRGSGSRVFGFGEGSSWARRMVTAALLTVLGTLVAPPTGAAEETASPLPPDPADWVCADPEPTIDPATWCETAREPRQSAQLGAAPALLNDVDGKNAFDTALKNFLVGLDYREKGLDWYGDANWRLTGPIVGPLPADGAFAGKSYGVHPAVRIYYSPEVVDWLCSDRQGEIAPGGMIIKEMRDLDKTPITAPDQCMEIPTDEPLEPTSWTVMVKGDGQTVDGWYWANPTNSVNDPDKSTPCPDREAFPQFLDASAITDPGFWTADCAPGEPTARLDAWYPTGLGSGRWSNVYPWSGFSAYCVNCHASAESELTYSSLDNVLSSGLRFKNFPTMSAAAATLPLTELRPSLTRHAPAMAADAMAAAAADAPTGPYPNPLPEPSEQFLAFFGKDLAAASYADAWRLRMPSETRDHYGAQPDRPGDFLTSDQCIGCHDATVSNDALPNMVLDPDGANINISPYAEWRVSPMGLAGRDPIFFSQLESEGLNLPELAECIENTCLHCHGVMGQRQFAADNPGGADAPCKSDIFAIEPPAGVPFGDEPYRRAWVAEWQADQEHNEYAALSRDGISCTVCHRITEESLKDGEAGYTGNFVTADTSDIYGPYADDTIVTQPMEHALDRLPVAGAQIQDSGICNSCHNILLPIFNNDGTPYEYKGPDGSLLKAKYEQTTGLEWTNSEFAQSGTFQSCQDCHMPGDFHGKDLPPTEIANIESSAFAPTTHRLPDADIALTPRDDFKRHALHGLNIFLNQMFQQFPMMLGFRQLDYMNSSTQPALITGADSMVEMATEQTASAEITEVTVDGDQLEATVRVSNDVGHYLPSGVGFRRVFLEFVVYSADGRSILFASGRTNDLGVIVDYSAATCTDLADTNSCAAAPGEDFYASKTAYQPHYQTISDSNQVQIYQELIRDSAGDFTTSFLRRVDDVKDNRLKPRGFDPKVFASNPSPYIQELAHPIGNTADDPYYTDPTLTGADEIEFRVPLGGQKPGRVEATLYSQSIPPFYLQQRFEDARLAADDAGNADIRRLFYLTSHLNTSGDDSPIRSWKLELTSACRNADGGACGAAATSLSP